jgi:Tfp pilus assembly protein PilF
MHQNANRSLGEVRALIEAGEYLQAAEALHQLLAVSPDDAEAHFFLGVAQMEQQHWDDAIESFERATQLDPELTSAWHNIGYCYYRQDRPDPAIPYLQRALEIRPDKWDSHLLLGLAQIQVGQLEQAAVHLEQALQYGGEEVPKRKVYEMLATIYEVFDQPTRAAHYRALLEAIPAPTSTKESVSVPRRVEHLILFPDAASASDALEAYRAAGFEAHLLDDPEEETHCVLVYDDTSTTGDAFERLVARLERIAEQYGGEYDGWGWEV